MTLTLVLDLLEKSEWKKTNFTTDVQENLVDIDNTAPSGTKVIMVKAAETATPVIQAGQTECCARATGKPLALTFKFVKTGNANVYDGAGELALDPVDAKLVLYKTDKCEVADKLTFVAGKLAISNGDLKTDGVTYYAKASANDVTGEAKLTLSLKANSDSKKVVACSPAMRVVALAEVNTVAPEINVALDASYDGSLWYPALARGTLPTMTLNIKQSNDGVEYMGDGLLTRSDNNVELYTDQALTKPLSFQNKQRIIPNADLKDLAKVYYLKGAGTGTTTLSLSLYDPKQPSIVIGNGVTTDINVKQVTEVESHVNWLVNEVQVRGENSSLNIFATQVTSGGGDYKQVGTLTRSHADLAVFDDASKAVFSGSNLTADIANDKLMTANKAYTAKWTGDQAPVDTVTLTLALQPSTKPYIITNPGTELLVQGVLVQPPVVVKPVNTVTPKIHTDYDLVMLDRSFVDGQVGDRTAPTLARIYVEQSAAQLGYDGSATLTRENDSIQIFRDDQLTDEISFYGDQSTISNSALKDKTKVYYIKGVTAGKTSLTLKLDGPNLAFPGLPIFAVAADAKKNLAVTTLALDLYRDDASGAQTAPVAAIDSVEMSTRAKRLTGRFVPLQNVAKQFGRAKLVVKKVETADWPSGADNHVVTLNVSNDVACVYDAAVNGAVVAKKGTPLQLKKADLTADKTYWVEGVGPKASTALRDEVFMVGLDRTDKDIADYPGVPASIAAKNNGDWGCGTVVTLSAVTPNVADWKQYVNQPPDHTLANNTNQAMAKDGRHLFVTATIDPAVGGVGLDFMLWADPANEADYPDGLKPMDTSTHVSTVTDSSGKANVLLKLSRYGGDKFTAVGFLADDAAKGAAVFGADATAAPDEFKSKPITVWRKLAYDLIYMKRHGGTAWGNDKYGINNNANNVVSNVFSQNDFEAAFAPSFLELEAENTKTVDNVPALYDGGLSPGGGTLFDNWYPGEVAQPAKDRFFSLMFIENISDGTKNWTQWFANPAVVGNQFKAGLNNLLFDLTAQNRYYSAGSCRIAKLNNLGAVTWQAGIADNKVKVVDAANGQYELQIDLTGVNLQGNALADLSIQVKLYQLNDFCGMSLPDVPYTVTAVRYAEQRGANINDEVYSTAVHEVGHFLGLAPKMLPDLAKTGNKLWYLGDEAAGTTDYYGRDVAGDPTVVVQDATDYGQGPHCMDGYNDFADLAANHGQAAKVNCLMFDSTVNPPVTRVCPVCLKSVQAREYALSGTEANAEY